MKKTKRKKMMDRNLVSKILKDYYSLSMVNYIAEKLSLLPYEQAYEKLGEFIALDRVSSIGVERLKSMLRELGCTNTDIFESIFYKKYRDKISIENDRIVNPPEISQGTYKCRNKKCNSTRTFSYQLQTRGADEPMTTFITCSDCGSRSKY